MGQSTGGTCDASLKAYAVTVHLKVKPALLYTSTPVGQSLFHLPQGRPS